MSIVYKTLFEVKLLHEYFLTKLKGETVFDLDHQKDRLEFLKEKFRNNEGSINDQLEFKLPDTISLIQKNYHLRLLTTYSGFKVAVEVTSASPLPDGTIRYKPVIPLSPVFSLFISITKKNNNIDSVSNTKISTPFSSIYYFSNTDVTGAKMFPFLSNPVPNFNASNIYEQGELAAFGANDIREFFKNDTGDQWRNLKGGGYVSESDRLLVPVRFDYTFNPTDNITNAEIVLKDKEGNEVKALQFSNAPLQKVTLDFRSVPLNTIPEETNADKNLYFLEVNGSNGFSKSYPLIFLSDSFATRNIWGMVHIQPVTANADFSLLDNDGFLKTTLVSGNELTGTPVFEIRLTSRLTYWRYSNDKRKKLKLSSATTDFLMNKDGRLIAKTPKPITDNVTFFKKESDGTFHYLPNPTPNEMLSLENKQFFSDILVPESDLFPVQP